jgi:copper resistance protein B
VKRHALLLPLLAMAQPAWAQHDHHAGHQSETPPSPPPEPDHSAMDHGHAGHPAPAGEAPIPEAPPPPEARSGPLHAADAAIGPERMAAARGELADEMGGMGLLRFKAERIEYRALSGKDGYLWDLQATAGNDIDKLWLKSEGDGVFGEKPEMADVEALWSHAIDPWWDLQLGLRHEFAGPDRTHAVIGAQGLAPYEIEIDAALFVSTSGDITSRIEAELDQRITQRLTLEPRAELAFSAQDVPERGIGAGLDHAEFGLRLRYEVTRQFAPYVGVEYERKFGQSARYARAAGEDAGETSVVVGVRFWF